MCRNPLAPQNCRPYGLLGRVAGGFDPGDIQIRPEGRPFSVDAFAYPSHPAVSRPDALGQEVAEPGLHPALAEYNAVEECDIIPTTRGLIRDTLDHLRASRDQLRGKKSRTGARRGTATAASRPVRPWASRNYRGGTPCFGSSTDADRGEAGNLPGSSCASPGGGYRQAGRPGTHRGRGIGHRCAHGDGKPGVGAEPDVACGGDPGSSAAVWMQ